MDRLWHCGMLSYLARNEMPNVNANPIRLLLGVFTPWLVNSITSLAFSVAILTGAALTLLPVWKVGI
jgi:hypothetical protein